MAETRESAYKVFVREGDGVSGEESVRVITEWLASRISLRCGSWWDWSRDFVPRVSQTAA